MSNHFGQLAIAVYKRDLPLIMFDECLVQPYDRFPKRILGQRPSPITIDARP